MLEWGQYRARIPSRHCILNHPTLPKHVLDFPAQAGQLLTLIEQNLQANRRAVALEFLILKFKALYEQGVLSGRLYEKDGVYPFNSFHDHTGA